MVSKKVLSVLLEFRFACHKGLLMVNGAGESEIKERKSSIAWFKLAELISRGEKEKALNLYRLLSHSFDDRGYVLQVEGDILWSFEDKAAIEKYQQAAFLYKKEQKLTAAVSVYEHLLTLHPENTEYLAQLVEYYIRLDWSEKVKDRFMVLLDLHKKSIVSEERLLNVIHSLSILFRELKGKNGRKKTECSFKMLVEIIKEEASGLVSKVKK